MQTALANVRSSARAKFDESVEVAVRLNIDTRKSDQNVRGAVELPHGTGRAVTVAVFAKDAKAEEALAAGAEHVGGADLVEKIKDGWLDFNQCIATPDMMGQVAQVARILGPKGLMPNPKLGACCVCVCVYVCVCVCVCVCSREEAWGGGVELVVVEVVRCVGGELRERFLSCCGG